jgi:hypothetical protein
VLSRSRVVFVLLLVAASLVALAWPALRRDRQRREDLVRIEAALETYRSRTGHYPPDVPDDVADKGSADVCIGLISGLGPMPVDPRSQLGQTMPDEEHPCYFYRRGFGSGYQLFARLELPLGSPAACGPGERYRPELHDYDVCILRDQPPRASLALRQRLRLADAREVELPVAVLCGMLALVGWRRRSSAVIETGPREWVWAAVGLGGLLVVAHLAMAHLIRWYYATYLPHYDSNGIYTILMRIVWMARGGHLPEAITYVQRSYLGWLAPAFALFCSPWIDPTPAGFQLLNTMCLGVLIASAAHLARQMGMSAAKASVAALVVLLPDAVTCWDAGYMDFKRDSQFLPLFGATCFLALARLWEPQAPRGWLLGLVAGLTVWTRGEAVGYVGALLWPLAVLSVSRYRWRGLVQTYGKATAVASAVAAPYLWFALGAVVRRRSDLTATYHATAWESLAAYWDSAFHLWTTTDRGIGGTPSVVALGVAEGVVLLFAALALFGWPRWPNAAPTRRLTDVVCGGAWLTIATTLLICLGTLWTPGFPYAGYHPFYPALVGLWLLCFALLDRGVGDAPARNPILRYAGVAVIGILMAGTTIGRMWLRAPDEPEPVALAHALVAKMRSLGDAPVVAVLTNDRINWYTLAFYDADRYVPGRSLERFLWVAPGGQTLDFDFAEPPRGQVRQYKRAIEDQLRSGADWILVAEDTTAYAAPSDNFFLYRDGKGLVDRLLADPTLSREDVVTLPSERRFVLLRNLHGPISRRVPAAS